MSSVLKSDYMRERYAGLCFGTSALGVTQAEFDAYYENKFVYWAKVLKDLNIRAN